MYFQFQIRLNRFEEESIYAESYNKIIICQDK